ncbi:hypothetical protein EBZ39_09705, partial [bacterium]|nr:hypothetical protein [bacterium]
MKAKSFRFRDGLKSLVIYRAGRGWRFEVKDADGSRRYVSRVKKAAIEQAARDYLGGVVYLDWQALTDKRKEFLAGVNELVQAGGVMHSIDLSNGQIVKQFTGLPREITSQPPRLAAIEG